MSQEPCLGVVHPTRDIKNRVQHQFVAKERDTVCSKVRTESHGRHVASMISIFNNPQANNPPVTKNHSQHSKHKILTPTHSSVPKLSPASKSSTRFCVDGPKNLKVRSKTLYLPRESDMDKVSSGSAELQFKSVDSRLNRTLEFFNKGPLKYSQSVNPTTKTSNLTSKSVTIDRIQSRVSSQVVHIASDISATSCSFESDYTDDGNIDDDDCIINEASKLVVKQTRDHNDEEFFGEDIISLIPPNRKSNDSSELNLPLKKQATSPPLSSYVLSHSPSPSVSTSSSLHSEPSSPQTVTVKQQSGVWFTNPNNLPTSNSNNYEARRHSYGSSAGRGRRKLSSPLPQKKQDSSNLGKSNSSFALSMTQKSKSEKRDAVISSQGKGLPKRSIHSREKEGDQKASSPSGNAKVTRTPRKDQKSACSMTILTASKTTPANSNEKEFQSVPPPNIITSTTNKHQSNNPSLPTKPLKLSPVIQSLATCQKKAKDKVGFEYLKDSQKSKQSSTGSFTAKHNVRTTKPIMSVRSRIALFTNAESGNEQVQNSKLKNSSEVKENVQESGLNGQQSDINKNKKPEQDISLKQVASQNCMEFEKQSETKSQCSKVSIPSSSEDNIICTSSQNQNKEHTNQSSDDNSTAMVKNDTELSLCSSAESNDMVFTSGEPTCTMRLKTSPETSTPITESDQVSSSISGSFYEEMLASITATIQSRDVVLTQKEQKMDEEQFHNAVEQLVQENPELVGNIYETIEQYKRQSQLMALSEFDHNQEPPELPPRPITMNKLTIQVPECTQPAEETRPKAGSFGSYVEMKPSVLSNETRISSPTSEYEPMEFAQESLRKESQKDLKTDSNFSRTAKNNQATKKKSRFQSFFSRSIKSTETSSDKKADIDERRSSTPSVTVSEYEILNSPQSLLCKAISLPTNQHGSSEYGDDKQPCVGTTLHRRASSENLFSQKTSVEASTPPLFTKLSLTCASNSRNESTTSIPTSNSDLSIHKCLSLTDLTSRGTSSPSGSITKYADMREDSDLDSSFDSTRGDERSPVSSNKLRRLSPEILKGSEQKKQLIAHTKRRASIPDTLSKNGEGSIEIPLVYADALMDRNGAAQDELSFSVSNVIAVLDMTEDDWWQGIVEDRIGWFPASWVRLRIGRDSDDSSSEGTTEGTKEELTSLSNGDHEGAKQNLESNSTCSLNGDETKNDTSAESVEEIKPLQDKPPRHQGRTRRMTITRRESVSDFPRKLTPAQIRARCVQEILTTERDYVQHLEDIIEGYVHPCQQHTKLFNSQQIQTIFSNIEELFTFQKQFLSELESRVVPHKMEESEIGQVFVQSRQNFAKYSEYCNNHPHAVNEMNLLQKDSQYTFFFESCRLLRNLTDISLDGFLLTPVQKICKYPLQLSELLKYTPETHPDYPQVLAAQDAMKEVALLINERKRRMENIGKIGVWQETIDNWKGSDIMVHSTEMIHFGELHKISKGHSQERHFFLFDNQLVYCKKDTIGGRLSYKGRVDLNKCVIRDIKDGEVTHNGSGVKYAWRINNVNKDKWYTLFAKSAQVKEEWMDAFKRERQRVDEDRQKEFVVNDKMKKAALALYTESTPTPTRKRATISARRNSDWASESAHAGVQSIPRLDTSSAKTRSLLHSPGDKKKSKKKR